MAAACFATFLAVSRKRSRSYHALLQQETELFNALSTVGVFTRNELPNKTASESTEHYTSGQTVFMQGGTLLLDDVRTEYIDEQQQEIVDFDVAALEGRYILREEIHGGGMSRIFLADSAKLGNQWIVKFISNKNGVLANEENILKLLNHMSLPRIVDIFRDDKGIYIVESYIEGVSLDKVMESGQKFTQTVIMDWAEQLAQALNYLHTMEPHPIFHLDLKPSNIIVTHDNRLVLIDFGISKRFGDDSTLATGITYKYAAPEQFKHRIPDRYVPLVNERFGVLPTDSHYWVPDARSDIFSLGVILFELAVGQIPTVDNMTTLENAVSNELSGIIRRCLFIEPSWRYQHVNEILDDLQRAKGSKIKMARMLFRRKLASVLAVFTIIASGGSLTGGYYINGQEGAAVLDVRPEIVTVSLQQSSDLAVEKIMPNGEIVYLDNSEIRWEFSQDSIVRIDGNRIAGINVGETELSGHYRNKNIELTVRVVEPMDGMADISQRYQAGNTIEIFAGTTERNHIDGALVDAEFVSPESIALADDGTIFIADSGLLRIIRGGRVESANFEPSYLAPHIVRCYKNDVYILTDAWEDDDGYYYGIIKLSEDDAEGLYIADASYTAVEDFTFSPDGLIYYIDRNEGVGATYLKTLDPGNVEDINTICKLPRGTSSLTIDEHGAVYLANPETGAIQVWRNGALSYFTGVENEKAFIDGTAPLFYMPQNIKYSGGFLYVWDFNVFRRISIIDGLAAECITIAGEASPVFDMDIGQTKVAAEDIVLPNSRLMDFAVDSNGVYLTDPKRGVIWWAE